MNWNINKRKLLKISQDFKTIFTELQVRKLLIKKKKVIE